ncbi:hypothetical protein KBC40_03340 [Patescibacteria group bacterium]|nr:hypothetical protein [Patescibacteria group bacterium]
MKFKVNQNQIEFDHLFFSVIIPKKDKIVYSFFNAWTISPAMTILSENRKINYKIPLISRLVFLLEVLINIRYRQLILVGKKSFFWTTSFTTITSRNIFSTKRGLSKIKSTLDLLKSYGYNVANADLELQKLVESEIKESKIYYTFKHRLKLFLILCFIGLVYCSLFYVSTDFETKKEAIGFFLVMFTPFLFLGTMALIFARTKLFFMKFFFILMLSLLIIAFIKQVIN